MDSGLVINNITHIKEGKKEDEEIAKWKWGDRLSGGTKSCGNQSMAVPSQHSTNAPSTALNHSILQHCHPFLSARSQKIKVNTHLWHRFLASTWHNKL